MNDTCYGARILVASLDRGQNASSILYFSPAMLATLSSRMQTPAGL